jgi:hypothetical protein
MAHARVYVFPPPDRGHLTNRCVSSQTASPSSTTCATPPSPFGYWTVRAPVTLYAGPGSPTEMSVHHESDGRLDESLSLNTLTKPVPLT